jgi:hypothetical protein
LFKINSGIIYLSKRFCFIDSHLVFKFTTMAPQSMDSERTFGPRPSTVPDDVTKSEKVEIEDTNGYAKDTADDEKTLAAENDADDLD